MRNWLREPLLHFVLLGALLFGIDHFIAAARTIRRTIVVAAEVDNEAETVVQRSPRPRARTRRN